MLQFFKIEVALEFKIIEMTPSIADPILSIRIFAVLFRLPAIVIEIKLNRL